MLVLSRDVNEKLIIGSAVVTIVSVRGRHVRLGIEAPGDVPIVRSELVARGEPGELHFEGAGKEGNRVA